MINFSLYHCKALTCLSFWGTDVTSWHLPLVFSISENVSAVKLHSSYTGNLSTWCAVLYIWVVTQKNEENTPPNDKMDEIYQVFITVSRWIFSHWLCCAGTFSTQQTDSSGCRGIKKSTLQLTSRLATWINTFMVVFYFLLFAHVSARLVHRRTVNPGIPTKREAGGSGGSRPLNEALTKALATLVVRPASDFMVQSSLELTGLFQMGGKGRHKWNAVMYCMWGSTLMLM